MGQYETIWAHVGPYGTGPGPSREAGSGQGPSGEAKPSGKNAPFLHTHTHMFMSKSMFFIEYYGKIYDKLVQDGSLPPEDKKFRQALIESFKKGEIFDMLDVTTETPQC